MMREREMRNFGIRRRMMREREMRSFSMPGSMMRRAAARGWMKRGGAAAALLLLAACGAGVPAEAPLRSASDAPMPISAAAQDTGYTAWRTLEMPSEPWKQRAASPAALLTLVRDIVAAQLEETDATVLPTRMQSEDADSAVGLLIHPDQADDSVRDTEFRLHMRRDGAQWTVVGVERRDRCRRGVSTGGLCI